jgi:hypothetical protein
MDDSSFALTMKGRTAASSPVVSGIGARLCRPSAGFAASPTSSSAAVECSFSQVGGESLCLGGSSSFVLLGGGNRTFGLEVTNAQQKPPTPINRWDSHASPVLGVSRRVEAPVRYSLTLQRREKQNPEDLSGCLSGCPRESARLPGPSPPASEQGQLPASSATSRDDKRDKEDVTDDDIEQMFNNPDDDESSDGGNAAAFGHVIARMQLAFATAAKDDEEQRRLMEAHAARTVLQDEQRLRSQLAVTEDELAHLHSLMQPQTLL